MENLSNDIEKQCMQTFESIKHVDDNGREFWYARELQAVLGYVKWERFVEVIEKAQTYFAVQTRKQEQGKQEANTTHFQVGQIVRETIVSLGGTMPENLPTQEVSVTKIIKQDQFTIAGNDDE